MTGVLVPPPLVTVMVLVCDVLPTVAVMIAVPAPTAVIRKFALAFPGEITVVAPTDTTVGADEVNETVVLDVTTALMPTVKTCELPGANVATAGVSDVNVGVPQIGRAHV